MDRTVFLQRRIKLVLLEKTYKEIGEEFGCTRQMVSDALCGKAKSKLAKNILKYIDELPNPAIRLKQLSKKAAIL